MKKILALALTLVLLVSVFPVGNAVELLDLPNETEYFITYSEDGDILHYNMPIEIMGNTRAEDGTYLKSTEIGRGSRRNVDLGDHPSTPYWRKAASYTFSSSVTVGMSATVSFVGSAGQILTATGTIGISASVSEGFSFTRTADETKFSKIRVYCDYDYIAYRGEVRDIYTDEILSTFNYATYVKTAEDCRVIYRGY